MFKSIYKIYQFVYVRLYYRYSHALTSLYFKINGVSHGSFISVGIPIISKQRNSLFEVSDDLVMVSDAKYATLGKNNRCKFVLSKGASLTMGNKIAMSNATIVATQKVSLGSNILIGGGVTIVDSDFHSLNPSHWHTSDDELNMRSAPVIINDNVFIGMNAVILKGVTIGENVIIAAGSVVFKSIPGGEVWGGNPAHFIKKNIIKT